VFIGGILLPFVTAVLEGKQKPSDGEPIFGTYGDVDRVFSKSQEEVQSLGWVSTEIASGSRDGAVFFL
jgi:hypothetical protein